MYRLYGMAAAILFMLGMAGYSAIDRNSNYKPARASVFLIDRKCDIVETATNAGGAKTTRIYSDDCKSISAWDTARAKRDKGISGSSTVKVSYTAPQDGSYQTSELHFTARDAEFYDLKAGDEIDVLVRNDDLHKIIKA
jgi:hypothetical protein